MTEAAIQKAIINLLVMHGWIVIRINSGGQKAEYTTKSGEKRTRWFWFAKWFASGYDEEKSGVSDLIATSPAGQTVYIETKSPGKKPTPKQSAFGEEILGRGGRWIVADSLDSAMMLINE